MHEEVNIRSLGAAGDGVHDESSVFADILRDHRNIYIPAGEYMVSETILIPSDTTIRADKMAHIFRKEHTQTRRRDYLLSNADIENGNENITITGGIWDGNCSIEDRGDDLFNQASITGVLLNFRKVKGIMLSNMTLSNPLCYYTRFCEAENVTAERIRLSSDRILPNQDGIHLAGFCRNFTIREIFGERNCPNDDFIALNADDSMRRQECFDSLCGPIEDICIENVHSELCHCFIRLLSVNSSIKNIRVNNVTGACKTYAVNLDAARYCRTPLFSDADHPEGVGKIENVLIEDIAVTHGESPDPFICLESNCDSLTVKNFENTGEQGAIFAAIHKVCGHEYELSTEETSESGSVDRSHGAVLNYDSVSEFQFHKHKNI